MKSTPSDVVLNAQLIVSTVKCYIEFILLRIASMADASIQTGAAYNSIEWATCAAISSFSERRDRYALKYPPRYLIADHEVIL